MARIGRLAVALGMLPLLVVPALAAPAKTRITFWDAWSGADQQVLSDLMKRFTEKSGIQVNLMSVAGQGNLLEKALVAIAGGGGPDLLVAHSLSFGSFINSGLFTDLKPLMKGAGIRESDFQKNYLDWMTSKGKVYGFPFSAYWSLVGYNRQVLEQSGIDPSRLPRDISEFDNVAAKLTKTQPNGTIDRMGFQPWFDWTMFPFIFGGGDSYFDEGKGRVAADSPGMTGYMEWCLSYGKRFSWPKMQAYYAKAGGILGNTADCPLYTGKMAMMVSGMWFVPYSKALSPKGSYGFASLPYPKGGLSDAYGPMGSGLMMPKSSKNKKATMELMKYIISDEFSTKWFYGVGNIPATASGLRKLKADNQDTAYRPFFSAVDDRPYFLPSIPNTVNYINSLEAARWDILAGKYSVTQGMKALQSQIQKEYLWQVKQR